MPSVTSHDALQQILRQVLELMDRNQVLDALARQQAGPKQELLEQLTHRQNLAALHNRLRGLHPADLAYLLEALPLRERLEAWHAVPAPGFTPGAHSSGRDPALPFRRLIRFVAGARSP